MDIRTGEIVRSRAGHDKGILYVVVGQTEAKLLLLADGRRKPLDKPKKKKLKHVSSVGRMEAVLIQALEARTGVFDPKAKTGDAWLRKCIKLCSARFQNEQEE